MPKKNKDSEKNEASSRESSKDKAESASPVSEDAKTIAEKLFRGLKNNQQLSKITLWFSPEQGQQFRDVIRVNLTINISMPFNTQIFRFPYGFLFLSLCLNPCIAQPEARINDSTRREVAFKSGAHFISTDYYLRRIELSDYSVTLPKGNPSTLNPIRFKEKCN